MDDRLNENFMAITGRRCGGRRSEQISLLDSI